MTNPDDAILSITMIGLAHGLRLKVLAEGVETEEQMNFCASGDATWRKVII